MEKDEKTLRELINLEDLAAKKARIYSRLLLDMNKAQMMEGIALRHETRKKRMETLLYGKPCEEA